MNDSRNGGKKASSYNSCKLLLFFNYTCVRKHGW